MGNSILEKIGAYFKDCSESFVTEGQLSAMLSAQIGSAPRLHWHPAPNTAAGISVKQG
jgi:hypothetical protein